MVPGYLGTLGVSEEDVGPHRGRQDEPGSGGKHEAGGPAAGCPAAWWTRARTHRNDRRGIRDPRGTRWGPGLNHDPSAVKASIPTLSRARRTQLWSTGLAGVLVREGVVGYITAPGEGGGGGKREGHLSIWASGHLGKVSGFGGAFWFHWASLARSVPFSVKPGWPIAEESFVGAQLGAEALGRPDLVLPCPLPVGRERGREGEKEAR